MFASANYNSIRRLLDNDDKQDALELLIKKNGFDKFITVRCILNNRWKDY